MKHFITILGFLLTPVFAFTSMSLLLPVNAKGKIQKFSWNFSTPLSLPYELGSVYDISLKVEDYTIPMKKTLETNYECIQYVYRLSEVFNVEMLKKQSCLLVSKNTPLFSVFNQYKVPVSIKTNAPDLEILTKSSDMEHGGAGLVVVKSESKENLSFLAVLDEKNIAYYPKTFVKNGYYTVVFPWYSDHSKKWTHRVVAVDKAGNITIQPLDSMKAKSREYTKKTITLPHDYASQKAKELSLSKEEAKKLEGNMLAINKVLSKQKTADRWGLTRTSFKDSINQVIKSTNFFSTVSIPMRGFVPTAGYGDQRTYTYQGKTVRYSVHRGLDMASKKNVPIYALMDGEVVYSDWNGGNGKTIFIDHGFHVYSFYAHNSELLVKEKDKVKSGQQIAISGTTGQSTGDHLHLSLIVQGIYVEPREWMSYDTINKKFHFPLEQAYQKIRNTK
ncbi:MAG: M23 family metallopeptidase [Brevinemataceae bacterium]